MDIIHVGVAGSRLYGLETQTSDYDTRGIQFEPIDHLLGMEPFKLHEDRETDTVIWGLKHFLQQAIKGTPNALELLFADPSTYIQTTEAWSRLVSIRSEFITKKMFQSYYGFIIANFRRIQNGVYDTKNASHILRILYNLFDLLEDGSFNPKLQGNQRNKVLMIKQGEMSIDHYCYTIEQLLEQLGTISLYHLTDEPNYAIINRTTIRIYTKHLKGLTNDFTNI